MNIGIDTTFLIEQLCIADALVVVHGEVMMQRRTRVPLSLDRTHPSTHPVTVQSRQLQLTQVTGPCFYV